MGRCRDKTGSAVGWSDRAGLGCQRPSFLGVSHMRADRLPDCDGPATCRRDPARAADNRVCQRLTSHVFSVVVDNARDLSRAWRSTVDVDSCDNRA